jgi:hypothetical protein
VAVVWRRSALEPAPLDRQTIVTALNDLTDAELQFIVTFAKDGAAGRHALCLVARVMFRLGMIGTAIAGIVAGYHALPSGWWR